MNIKISIFFLIAYLMVSIFSSKLFAEKNDINFNTGTQLSQEQKLSDFKYMYNILKENYPFFGVNKRVNNIDWLSNKETYINRIKQTKNDKDFFNTLTNILDDLHNAHTHMYTQSDYDYWKNTVLNWDGRNEAWLNQLNFEKSLKRYSQNNTNVSSIMQFNNNYRNIIGSTKLSTSQNNIEIRLLDNDVAYLYIKGFDINDIDKDYATLTNFFNNIKEYKKLVIDIRGNGGGFDKYWQDNIVKQLSSKPLYDKSYFVFKGSTFEEPFIKDNFGFGYDSMLNIDNIINEKLPLLPSEISDYFKYYFKFENIIQPQNSIGFKGNIYLLVDKNVFSSAESFAIFCKDTGFATLVGETTGGDGIVGSIPCCALPNSGFIFGFYMTMGLTSDGSCNAEMKTTPDIYVSNKWYLNLFKDSSIEFVLSGKVQYFGLHDFVKILICILVISAIILTKIFIRKKKKEKNSKKVIYNLNK